MTSTNGSAKDIGVGESSATTMRPSKTVRADRTRRRATSGRLNVLTAMVTVLADSARSPGSGRSAASRSTPRTPTRAAAVATR